MDLKKETSPAPSTSAKGLKGVIAKIGRKDDPSLTSLTSLNGTDDSGEQRSGLRDSVDSLKDRTRIGRTASVADDGLPPGPSKISKLIPGRARKKRRQREEAEQLQQEAEAERGRSADDQAATAARSQSSSANRSPSGAGEDGGSSLITVDSDNDSPDAARPPLLMNHESHAGYLTASSPLIQVNPTSDENVGNLPLENLEFQNPELHKTNTLPPATSGPAPLPNLAPQHATTFDSRQSEGSFGAGDSRRNRGISPAAKIRDVFTPGSKRKNSSPPKTPDAASVKSGIGRAFTGPDKGRQTNALGAGNGSQASGSVPTINVDDAKTSATAVVRDLPTLSTAPRTPPSAIVEAPETTVTPPTPTDHRRSFQNDSFDRAPVIGSTGPNITVSPSGNMISHRRVRSDSVTHGPSKLSNSMSAPLTPMAEESKTPGARQSPGLQFASGGGGFFSSVFSAAQNAANSLTNTMSSQPRSLSSTRPIDEDVSANGSDISTIGVSEGEADPVEEKKQLAIDTLGSGDLSLSHLGIAADTASATSPSGTLPNNLSEQSRNGVAVLREEAAARAEDASASRAVSAAYSEKPLSDTGTTIAEDRPIKPKSFYEPSIATGEKTPPTGSIYEGEHGSRRSGSVRSRVGAVTRRHRNSSSATGGTIGAAIGASHAALVNPAAGVAQKISGFAVATKKRNRDFHQLFRSVPENDFLIEDYSCALQRDIILAGRIYISEGYICFSSNILGWVTTLIISFEEIVSVEKENTAMVFPNAIAIQTLHARHTFRSLLSREATYDLIINIWKLSHPNLKSSLNGARLDQGGTGDKTEKVDPSGSDETSEITEEDEEIYEQDYDQNDDLGSITENGEGTVINGEAGGEQGTNGVSRKASAMGVAIGAAAAGMPTGSDAKNGEKAAVAAAASVDFPGPATHAPTECSDGDTHYEKFLKDDIIPAPLGKVYSMVFGPASGGFMARWLLDEVKVTELSMQDDKKGLGEENRSRTFTYIKPLYASIGPKTTKCVVTETLDSIDLERAVSVTASTQTPDVPSGNVFVTKTRFCFMWAPGNATRVLMNFTIEWSGKSWLKGPIEKGAADGQLTYCNDLIKALKAGVTSRPRTNTKTKAVVKNGKRVKTSLSSTTTKIPSASESAASSIHNNSRGSATSGFSWGPLEPVHAIGSAIVDIVGPMISANMIIVFLLVTILFTNLRSPSPSGDRSSVLTYPLTHSERLAAYEELWRREESELWEWLERRVGGSYAGGGNVVSDAEWGTRGGGGGRGRGDGGVQERKRRARERELGRRVRGLRMSEREVELAIRVTEERLGVLRRAVLGQGERAEGEMGEGVGGEREKEEDAVGEREKA